MSNIKHFILKTFASSIIGFMVVNQNFASCMEQSAYENLESKVKNDEDRIHYLHDEFINYMVKEGYKVESIVYAGNSGDTYTYLATDCSNRPRMLKFITSHGSTSFYVVGYII